jgi:hypothetical protein
MTVSISSASTKNDAIDAIHALVADGNSVRRASRTVSALLGADLAGLIMPAYDDEGTRHFYSPASPGSLAACGADEARVTRRGYRVDCDDCKEIHRAAKELDAATALAAKDDLINLGFEAAVLDA